jgi:hypothetical protein
MKKETFLFSETSRSALVSIQPPIQWTSRTIFLELKLPGSEANESVPSIAVFKKVWSVTALQFALLRQAQGQCYLYLSFPSELPVLKHKILWSFRKWLKLGTRSV